ncbi:MAG: hypothetical protein ACI81L_001908 [Verrucomicrobiales bacterium]
MKGRAPTKNGAVTGLQSNAATRRPLRVPTAEELPPLFARTPLALFDEALTFLRIQPALLFGIATIVLLPLRLVAAAMPGSPLRDARPDQLADIFIGNLSQPGAVAAAIVTLALESVALLTVASIYGELVASWYSGRTMSATDLLMSSIKRSPIIIAAWISTRLLVVTGAFITLGILGLLVGVFFAVVGPVLGAENARPIEAMRRSSQLVSAKLGQTILVFAVTGLGGVLMRIMIEVAPSVITNQLGIGLPLWITSGVTDIVASIIVIAFTASASVMLYLDLRVRREGIDLDMAIERSFSARRSGGGRRG